MKRNVPRTTGLPPGLEGLRHRAYWFPGGSQVSPRGQFSTLHWPQLFPGLPCTSLPLPGAPLLLVKVKAWAVRLLRARRRCLICGE